MEACEERSFERGLAGKRTAPPRSLMLKSMICQLWRSLSHCPTLVFFYSRSFSPTRTHLQRPERGEERREEREESVPGEPSHSFIFIFTRHMFACLGESKEREKEKEKEERNLLRAPSAHEASRLFRTFLLHV